MLANERLRNLAAVGTIVIAIVAILSVMWAVVDSTVSPLRDEVRRLRMEIGELRQEQQQGFQQTSTDVRSTLAEHEHTDEGVRVPLK